MVYAWAANKTNLIEMGTAGALGRTGPMADDGRDMIHNSLALVG